jgi:hypothetical protein
MKFSRTFSCCLLFLRRFLFFLSHSLDSRALGGSVTALSPGQKFCFAAQCDDIVLFRASGVAPRLQKFCRLGLNYHSNAAVDVFCQQLLELFDYEQFLTMYRVGGG